jgi:diguanylate cyclase (GGDEF)-like protein/PAS domain S-box-containing protein
MKSKTCFLLAALNIGIVFALAAIWEFGPKESVVATLIADFAYETPAEHWEYAITSTVFAALALAMPLALSFRISARCEQAEDALRVSERRAHAIAEALPSRISYVDREQRYRFTNRAYGEFYNIKTDDLYGKKVRDLLGEDTYSKIEKYIDRVFTGKAVQYELEQSVGSDQRSYDITYVPDFDSDGSVRGFCVLINDITDRKRAADDLFHEKERAQVTLESIADAVITTDPLAKIDYLNPVAARLTGWCQDEALGQRLDQVFRVISEESPQPMPDPVAQCLAGGRAVELQGHNLLLSRTGQEYAIQATAAPIRGRQGQVLGAVLVFHDVTAMRRMAQQLAYDAAHDPLTGLVNRREFAKRLERSVASAKQHGSHHALCYFDLDLFKLVNDTAGHQAGDELLKQITGLLSGKVRQRDTLARLGGDEFGLLLDNCLLDDAEKVCEIIVSTFRDFRFFWEGRAFQVGASVGLVPITADAADAVELLTHADVACYTAKEQGRGRVHVYRKEGFAPAPSQRNAVGI